MPRRSADVGLAGPRLCVSVALRAVAGLFWGCCSASVLSCCCSCWWWGSQVNECLGWVGLSLSARITKSPNHVPKIIATGESRINAPPRITRFQYCHGTSCNIFLLVKLQLCNMAREHKMVVHPACQDANSL